MGTRPIEHPPSDLSSFRGCRGLQSLTQGYLLPLGMARPHASFIFSLSETANFPNPAAALPLSFMAAETSTSEGAALVE
jgi:hypothetical protein